MSTTEHLSSVKNSRPCRAELATRAVNLAAEMLAEANAAKTSADLRQGEKISRLMDDPQGKGFTVALTDRAFRSTNPRIVTKQLRRMVRDYGIPRYLFPSEKILLKLGALASHLLPGLVASQVTKTLRKESSSVILQAERTALSAHVRRRHKDGMRLNLNRLGEAILGEEEAARRLRMNLDLLASEETGCISIKISSIFAHCTPLAFEWTVKGIQSRLRELYRSAILNAVTLPDGGRRPKFVNLDMEEYRDLELTLTAFTRTLDEPEFQTLQAGIALQTYLPDSRAALEKLTAWAKRRVAAGGAPIKVRLVKGANLAMESAEAAIKGWECAPYSSKAQVDANYKGCVNFCLTPENAAAVRVGVASHNLFDIAYALLLRSANGLGEEVEIEMLEGMANHQSGVVCRAAGGLLLYAPVVTEADFQSAIGYLVRRLDENTSPENFLHDLFGLTPGSEAWERQKNKFLQAVAESETVDTRPRRTQDRRARTHSPEDFSGCYRASADTDWALSPNRAWLETSLARGRAMREVVVPLSIGGEDLLPNLDGQGADPSRPGEVCYRYAIADDRLTESALDCAVSAGPEWAARPLSERRSILISVAAELENSRGELIAAMVVDGGKTASEADAEVSEAVDFANFYARAFDDPEALAGVSGKPLGAVTLAPPWNFPVAIPAGGALAALMAGCPVILKPAPESVLCGRRLMEALWRGGVPPKVAQFVVTRDDDTGRKLVTDRRVAAVVLTGSTSTADLFLSWKPSLRLFAETGGKNSLIVTANADRELAVKDLVKSAFGHAGQKCSAASLGILEAEVYDDAAFLRRLRDAASSLVVGEAGSPETDMPPVIRPPEPETLLRALQQNETGESWLLEPKRDTHNPNLWTPGIKLGVTQDSWFRDTECFGPVLGLVRADNLLHAIGIANASRYGLTGGIHSLDEREITLWKETVEVGNAYVNRPITGAIVNRQPFGGWKNSSYGPGAKAGGRNYVAQFLAWENTGSALPQAAPSAKVTEALPGLIAYAGERSATTLRLAAGHYARSLEREFLTEHDPAGLAVESNVFRYRRDERAIVRFGKNDSPAELALTLLACLTTGITATVSLEPGSPKPPRLQGITSVEETENELAIRLERDRPSGIFRSVSPPGDELLRALRAAHLRPVFGAPVVNGLIELRAHYREQSVSQTLHRYGALVTPPAIRRGVGAAD